MILISRTVRNLACEQAIWGRGALELPTTVARGDKRLPRIQNTPQNRKTIPRIQNKSQNPKTLLQNPKHVQESKTRPKNQDHIQGFNTTQNLKHVWILGRVLDSGERFVPMSHGTSPPQRGCSPGWGLLL